MSNKGRDKLAALGVVPIGFDLDEASAFVGLSPRAFCKAVKAGIYPPPMPSTGRKRIWNRVTLETALGIHSSAHDPIMGMIDDAIRQGVSGKG